MSWCSCARVGGGAIASGGTHREQPHRCLLGATVSLGRCAFWFHRALLSSTDEAAAAAAEQLLRFKDTMARSGRV